MVLTVADAEPAPAMSLLCQAKELIMRSLPVPESVLKRHADAIGPIFAKKKQQILQVRMT
jgi:hypothetical protein